MGNLMSNLYIAYVVEVIKDTNNIPTTELRIVVPSIHGLNYTDNSRLPIAPPLVIPGMSISSQDLETIYTDYMIGSTVIVMFIQGNYSKPVYLGVLGHLPSIVHN